MRLLALIKQKFIVMVRAFDVDFSSIAQMLQLLTLLLLTGLH